MAPRARFELATLRLTAERSENLSALSGVAYEKSGAILTLLAAPNPAPKKYLQTVGHLKCYSYNTASDNFRVSDKPSGILVITSHRPACGQQ